MAAISGGVRIGDATSSSSIGQLVEVPGHILHTPTTVKLAGWPSRAFGVLAANLGSVRRAESYSRSVGQRCRNRSDQTWRVRAGEQLETCAISIQASQLVCAGLLPVPQDAPQDLACRRLGDLVYHLDAPDLLVRSDPRRHALHDLFGILRRLQHD